MKYCFLFLFLTCFWVGDTAQKNGKKDSIAQQRELVLDAQKQVIKDYKEEASANQDTLTELLISRKPKRIIVEKPVIQYVKIYKMVPIYVPVQDSLSYKKTFQKDTLEGNYYMDEGVFKNENPPVGRTKKKSFLWKLFHKK